MSNLKNMSLEDLQKLLCILQIKKHRLQLEIKE